MPSQRDSRANPGILSNVFSFMSREIGSFVSSAVGGSSSSSQKISSRRRHGEKPYQARDELLRKKRRKKPSGDHVPGQRRSKSGDPQAERDNKSDHEMPPPALPTKRKNPSRKASKTSSSPARTLTPNLRSSHPAHPNKSLESPCRDLSLPQVPREFLKKPVTMPGALFPRSPSLDPDYASAIEEQHRVHFALGTPNPSFRSYSDLMREATDGSPSTFHVDPPKVGDIPRHDPTASPVRANGGPSVKGAIERFADDADHSLMLPNLTTSPGRAAPLSSPQRVDGTAEIASLSSKAKGKQRAMDWDYNFAEANTTGEIRVRGKEQELLEAREEHIRKEQDRELDPDQSAYFEEREKDKERIRALEAEVVQLKEQLARQRVNSLRADCPPPPPPPPLPTAAFMPTLAEIRNRTGASGSATESFLLTARASLKHTAPPIEAPINPVVYGGRTKRTGRPTVNVPTEKMASFLNEVKSAKLKKISNHFAPPLRPAPEEVGNVSLSSGMRRDILRDIARRKSLATLRPEPTTGEKWKRGVTGDSDLVESAARAKRKPQDRPTSFLSPDSSASSFASTSSNVPFDRRSISNTNAAYNRTWPSITTDFTTPSLTSDNENDHEGENSPSNRLPATPPILEEPAQPESVTLSQSQTIAHAQQGTSDKDRQLQPPIITSSLLDDPLPELSSSPPRSPTPSPPEIEVLQPQPRLPSSRSSRNAFAKRVPSSPMPSTTPKKPLPPARKRPKSRIIIDSEDEGVGNEEVEEDQQDEEPLTMPLFDPTFPSQTKRELRSAPEPAAIPALAKPVPTRIPKKRAAGNTSSLKRKATSSDLRAQSNGANSSKGLNGSTASTSSRSSKSNLPRPAPSTSNHAKRRKTLDEEIRKAGDILWSEGDSGGNHGHDEDEAEEDGVLTGVGMKKGFLAGGGAGGAPVFMGPGYVEGAEDDRMRGGNEFAFPIEDMDEDEFRDEGFRKSVRRTNSRNKGKARLRV